MTTQLFYQFSWSYVWSKSFGKANLMFDFISSCVILASERKSIIFSFLNRILNKCKLRLQPPTKDSKSHCKGLIIVMIIVLRILVHPYKFHFEWDLLLKSKRHHLVYFNRTHWPVNHCWSVNWSTILQRRTWHKYAMTQDVTANQHVEMNLMWWIAKESK